MKAGCENFNHVKISVYMVYIVNVPIISDPQLVRYGLAHDRCACV